MDVLDVLVDKLDALGVLVVIVAYVLIREKNTQKVSNPNGIIKAIESLAAEVREHNRQSSERMILMAERMENQGRNIETLFDRLKDVNDTCTTIRESVRRNPE